MNKTVVIDGDMNLLNRIDGEVNLHSQIDGEMDTILNAGGTRDYERLQNLPSIESVTLIGNKTFEQLGMSSLSNMEIEELLS